MVFIDWSESMSVGVPLVDRDHKVLVSLLNNFHESTTPGSNDKIIEQTLKTLSDYIVYHFAREEEVMKACHYPDHEAHKKLHDSLVEQVTSISLRFFENKEDISKEDLLDFLKEWLVNHILKQDMAFRPYAEFNTAVQELPQSSWNNESVENVKETYVI